MSALWIMAAVLEIMEKAADLHIALGEPEAFVGEEDKLQPLRPHHLQTGLKQFQLEAEILALWEHFHGWKKAAALQETMLWQVPEVQWMS